ncbi:MAG: hypothetical protein NVSMB10_17460 [Steroidobacteraceae bacterium]
MWDFSVRDPVVAAQLTKAVGRRVQLHYTDHPGLPTACFSETRFFVDRVTVVTDDEPTKRAAPAAAPTPAVPPVAPAAKPNATPPPAP